MRGKNAYVGNKCEMRTWTIDAINISRLVTNLLTANERSKC